MSGEVCFCAVILIIVGLTHIDDASAGHVRTGWAALGIGGLLVVVAVAMYAIEARAPHLTTTEEDDD